MVEQAKTNEAPNMNYRIEKISNGYVLHITAGKEGGHTRKVAFLEKNNMLAFLSDVL